MQAAHDDVNGSEEEETTDEKYKVIEHSTDRENRNYVGGKKMAQIRDGGEDAQDALSCRSYPPCNYT